VFHLVLYQPEIPPNTGNIIRLCANTGSQLHLIHPLGFALDDKRLKRAGLDYHEYAEVRQHKSLQSFQAEVNPDRLFAISTKCGQVYSAPKFQQGDTFLFGPETRGLPAAVRDSMPEKSCLRIPMLPGQRSLNLSNAAAIILYEAWRQNGFGPG